MNRIQISNQATHSLFTPGAQEFLLKLHDHFEIERQRLLIARQVRQKKIASGDSPDFLPHTRSVREGNWKVAPVPTLIQDRRVEITGPAEPKMMINALNSSAKVFMADLEDALSPTWKNILEGHTALTEAVRGTLQFEGPQGKTYRLNEKTAVLMVRPRGWHLSEKHFKIDQQPMSASLFDFGLFFFHNGKEAFQRKTGPFFYLPKMESHEEARLWNSVFNFAQDEVGIPRGTIKATVLIETILAAFEMDEILYELKDHIAGLNAGRWDYIFSLIKKFSHSPAQVLPDRAQVTMNIPFMKAYAELLVSTCHRRGAHAMGGMSAFIPNRKDPAVTEAALKKVKEDKEREANLGFDGTWVAHPDLVSIAQAEFDRAMGSKPNQKDRLQVAPIISAEQLINTLIPEGSCTEMGFRSNIEIALQYIERWISGQGAVAIHNLMEDAATAEISRAQIWQWIRHQVKLTSGVVADRGLYQQIRNEEVKKLNESWRNSSPNSSAVRYDEAATVLDQLILTENFPDFLTLVAESRLEQEGVTHERILPTISPNL